MRERLELLLWRVEGLWHPHMRLCRECKLTREGRAEMRRRGGVCHDCIGDRISAEIAAEQAQTRQSGGDDA